MVGNSYYKAETEFQRQMMFASLDSDGLTGVRMAFLPAFKASQYKSADQMTVTHGDQ